MIPDIIFKQTYEWEKGFVNDPDDLGGLTNDGITYNTYKRLCSVIFRRQPSVKHFSNLTMTQKKMFYNYSWVIVRADQVNNLAIAGCWFDFNFNSDGAEKVVQAMLNEKYQSGLVVDGIVGIKTIGAINNAIEKGIEPLINNIQDARLAYVTSLTVKRPNQIKFLNGWTNRIEDWRSFAMAIKDMVV